ncbi:hypothetical protein GmHk_18G051616 [Glycine max]|nr:hypothetical protein GmHk_18G051616 [Glycine max]
MGFIGLVTWSGGKRAMKESIKEAQRVFKGYIEKQLEFGLEGVTRDKIVFGMKKHGHMSFVILTRDSYSRPFGFSTYQVRTFYLPPSSLEAHAWCCHCPSVSQSNVYSTLLVAYGTPTKRVERVISDWEDLKTNS